MLLSQAMAEGLFHPRCRHGLGTYYPELEDIVHYYTEENRVNEYGTDKLNQAHIENMIQKYKRLTVGSVDPENIAKYQAKLNEWEKKKAQLGVANSAYSDIIMRKDIEMVDESVHNICKIDKEIYSCVTPNIQSDEVIITDKQISHIMERHPNDYERYYGYIKQIIQHPDYILEANKPNTAFVLKHIEDNGKNYELILRLKTSDDPTEYKNSVITFLKVEEKRYNRYLRTKKILYKSE